MENLKGNLVTSAQLRVIEGFNVREDYGDIKGLAKSIKEVGVLDALKVRKTKTKPTKNEDGEPIFDVIDGHRRLEATKIAEDGQDEYIYIPVLFVEDGEEEARLVEEMLATGENKKLLNAYEQMKGIRRLLDMGRKKADIARALGKSQTYVNDCLMLENASEAIIEQIKNGAISATTAIEILKAHSADEAEDMVTQTVNAGKKATSANVEKVTGKAATKKSSSSAGAGNRKDATERSSAATGKSNAVEDLIEQLEGVQTSMKKQAKELTTKPGTLEVLGAIIKWMKGDLEPIEMLNFFFEDAPEPAKSKKSAAKKAPAAVYEGGEDEEDEAPAKSNRHGVDLKEVFNSKSKTEKPAASKKAAAGKAASKKVTPPELDEDDDDLDGDFDDEEDVKPAKKATGKKAAAPATKKSAAKKKAEEDEPEDEDLDDDFSDLEIDDDDEDDL